MIIIYSVKGKQNPSRGIKFESNSRDGPLRNELLPAPPLQQLKMLWDGSTDGDAPRSSFPTAGLCLRPSPSCSWRASQAPCSALRAPGQDTAEAPLSREGLLGGPICAHKAAVVTSNMGAAHQ